MPRNDPTVHGDLLARAHDDHFTDSKVVDRDFHLLGGAFDPRHPRSELEQVFESTPARDPL